jgi:hypothetical protein
MVATCGMDGRVCIWDVPAWSLRAELNGATGRSGGGSSGGGGGGGSGGADGGGGGSGSVAPGMGSPRRCVRARVCV